MKKRKYAVADATSPAWKLAPNEVWNVPDGNEDIQGSLKTYGSWQIPVTYRALVIGFHGYVYGIRTMFAVRESGYDLEGRVKVFGRSWRAFTTSVMFERPDGSLINVAAIHACIRGRYPRRSDLKVSYYDVSQYRYTVQERPEFGYNGYALMAYDLEAGYRDPERFSADITCGEPL